MKNKKLLLIDSTLLAALIFSIFSISAYAQSGNVNFSGKWALNESKSNLGEGRMRFAATSLEVKQDGNTLSVERTMTRQDGGTNTTTQKYTLDGQPSSNVRGGNSTPSETSVTWNENRTSLNFQTSRTMSRQGQTATVNSTEAWSLSRDGNTLTINVRMTTQQGETTRRLIYDKK
jgi:hypothetical protein